MTSYFLDTTEEDLRLWVKFWEGKKTIFMFMNHYITWDICNTSNTVTYAAYLNQNAGKLYYHYFQKYKVNHVHEDL